MNNKKYDGRLYDVHYIETIKELVVDTVRRYPKREAYLYRDIHDEPFKKITYSEFDKNRRALGTALWSRGFSGAKAAVIGENSYRWVLSYFTVVCGLGAIVPIDRKLKYDEIVNLLKRADVELVFTSLSMLENIKRAMIDVPTLKTAVLMPPYGNLDNFTAGENEITTQSELIREGAELIKNGVRDYIDAEPDQEDLSTILFTSGTTGLAKGVMLSHRNLAQNVLNMSKYFHIPDAGRVLDILPMHHAYEMTCTVMTCFYQGATVVICEGLKHMQTNFKETGCSVMLGVPLIYENLYRKIWTKAKKSGNEYKLRRAIGISKRLGLGGSRSAVRRMFKSIHDLFGRNFYSFIAGGAAIDPRVIVEFEAIGLAMIQGYGMTENAPIIAMNTDRYGKAASAGKALPGTEVRIVDKDESGIGEIICKGSSVMMGYYKDPANTAAAIKDGWLYTGDYGYFDEDGFLFITGRKKNVIVTKGGKNIFPEEVEYYLLMSEYVNDVIVYGKEESVKGDVICTAIIYPEYNLLGYQGYTEDEEIYQALKIAVEHANAKMPPYKRVKRIEVRDKDFIRTTTLKIKRFEVENYDYKFDSKDFDDGRRF